MGSGGSGGDEGQANELVSVAIVGGRGGNSSKPSRRHRLRGKSVVDGDDGNGKNISKRENVKEMHLDRRILIQWTKALTDRKTKPQPIEEETDSYYYQHHKCIHH